MKRRLSQERTRNAVSYGEAVAKTFLKDFIDHPEWFSKEPWALSILAGRIAFMDVFMSCTWECSEEEQQIAQKAAEDLVDLAISFAKAIPSNQVI